MLATDICNSIGIREIQSRANNTCFINTSLSANHHAVFALKRQLIHHYCKCHPTHLVVLEAEGAAVDGCFWSLFSYKERLNKIQSFSDTPNDCSILPKSSNSGFTPCFTRRLNVLTAVINRSIPTFSTNRWI